MATPNTRERILTYLKRLPADQSIQIDELARAIGLQTNQVHPALAAAKRRGEIESVANGSVRLTSATRGQFQDGKPPPAKGLPDSIAIPLAILKEAIEYVPAVKYALGTTGIAAAAAIAYVLLTNLQDVRVWIVVGVVIVAGLFLMVLLFIFAKLVEVGGWIVRLAGIILMYFVLLITMASLTLLFTSIFFRWPRDIRDYFADADGKRISELVEAVDRASPEAVRAAENGRHALRTDPVGQAASMLASCQRRTQSPL